MISSNLVFVQLAQYDDYICIRELAKLLEAPVSVLRHKLKDLGDRVEHNDRDEWRIAREIVVNVRLLSEAEKVERDNLERTVQQAFAIAGKALKLLRDKRLYRETHATFESYVRDRFDFTKRAAYYLIDAHEVVNNLKSEQFVHTNKNTNILPTKESQCRPLAKLPPERQREVWRDAIEKANGKVPSARIIKEIVKQNSSHLDIKTKPEDKELIYKPGTGIDYVVHLDEETYRLLKIYQDRMGTATKNGAIRRLLNDAHWRSQIPAGSLLTKQKQNIALNLLHLLFINKLRYNEKWECWTGFIVTSEDKWGEIPYGQLTDIAALLVSGLTKKRASIEETRVLLQQIERWVVQSNGKLVEVKESKNRTKWYPACLVEAAMDEERITA